MEKNNLIEIQPNVYVNPYESKPGPNLPRKKQKLWSKAKELGLEENLNYRTSTKKDIAKVILKDIIKRNSKRIEHTNLQKIENFIRIIKEKFQF